LKPTIYKGAFMEDCPVENPFLDGILKICVGNYKGFYDIRRTGTRIKLFLI